MAIQLYTLMNFLNIVIQLSLVDIRFKIHVPNSRINVRQSFFCVRVINVWNSLPDNIVSATSPALFNKLLHDISLFITIFVCIMLNYLNLHTVFTVNIVSHRWMLCF